MPYSGGMSIRGFILYMTLVAALLTGRMILPAPWDTACLAGLWFTVAVQLCRLVRARKARRL